MISKESKADLAVSSAMMGSICRGIGEQRGGWVDGWKREEREREDGSSPSSRSLSEEDNERDGKFPGFLF